MNLKVNKIINYKRTTRTNTNSYIHTHTRAPVNKVLVVKERRVGRSVGRSLWIVTKNRSILEYLLFYRDVMIVWFKFHQQMAFAFKL
jgi:hypothetical protein